MTGTNSQFQALWDKAVEAGKAAGNATKPRAMIVGSPSTPFGNDIDPNQQTWYEPEGVCGFAWVKIRPATTPFARFLKKMGYASPAYNGGLEVWISDYNQSMQRKEAHARAMAKVFSDAGINAYADSRMD
jgi:hypothetical protein